MGLMESVALHEELGRGPVAESLIAGSLAAQALALTNEHRLLERVTAGDTCWRSLGKKCRTDRGWATGLHTPGYSLL